MTDWKEVYRPLIGRQVEAVIWMPMTSDTPQLVEEFTEPAFSFTGAVFLSFGDGKDLFLTWKQIGSNMVLVGGREHAWRRHTLDRVRVSPHEPWEGIETATLKSVALFSAPGVDDDNVVGVRHGVQADGRDRHFWVGTGGPDFIGDMSDLWVGVDHDPPNLADLTLVGSIGR